jgi:hypothetical protein
MLAAGNLEGKAEVEAVIPDRCVVGLKMIW